MSTYSLLMLVLFVVLRETGCEILGSQAKQGIEISRGDGGRGRSGEVGRLIGPGKR